MYCGKCGSLIENNAKFCPNCGQKTGAASSAAQSAPRQDNNAAQQQGSYQAQQPVYAQPVYAQPEAPVKKKKTGCLVAAIIAIVLLAALIFGCVLLARGCAGVADSFLESDGWEDDAADAWDGSDDYEYEEDDGGLLDSILDLIGGSAATESSGAVLAGESVDIAYTDLRARYTKLAGDGTDKATVMVYMIGSDLESEYGAATSDINEMQYASLSDSVNVVLQTGGAKEWQNSVIKSSSVGRYQLDGNGLTALAQLGNKDMCKSAQLRDFIQFCAKEYPADRYILVLWDHGGGTMSGFGYDENFESSMTLADIDSALSSAGVKFDIVGFDACLMATVETAYMLEEHADYLLASEETEPGLGWYYTDWLTLLSENPSVDSVALCKRIIDDFVEKCGLREATTLSVTDLREIPATYRALVSFLDASDTVLTEQKDYRTFSSARADARSYGEDGFEQIDAVDYVERTGLSEGAQIAAAVRSAVKYHSGTLASSNGLAMYFPYSELDYYSDVLSVMEQIGIDSDYTAFFNRFVSITAGGKRSDEDTRSPAESLGGAESEASDYASSDWYDASAVSDYASSYDENAYQELTISEKNDGFVLQLSDEEWDNIAGIELQVWLDDGEGYCDLGSDAMYEFDDDGDLKLDFDNTWVSLNGQIVPFYQESEIEYADGGWTSSGSVPCLVNGEERELLVCWSDEKPSGYVAGYRSVSQPGVPAGKGLIPFEAGDVITVIVDYYTYDGTYDAVYQLGEEMTYGTGLTVSYEDVGEGDCLVYYMLTDLYQNHYWTEALEFSLPDAA